MQSLTAKDITDAARKYLTTTRMTLYDYRPKGAPESSKEAALQFVQQAIASAPKTPGDDVPVTVPNVAVKGAAATKAPQQTKLSNGATLIVEERAGAPIVSAGVYFRRGRSNENSANAGITQLMTRSMRRGTSSRSAEQIDREIEYLGTQIGTTAQRDYFGFNVSAISRNFRPAFALVSDVVLNPTFPEKGVTEDKHLQKASIKRGYDSALQRPSEMVYEAFYRNHPYALPADGYVSSVDATTPAALRAWWERHVVADDAVIVIVGDIATDDAVKVAEDLFGKLRKRTTPEPELLAPVMPAARAELNEFRDRKQSAIGVAFPTVPITHPDWVKLRMLQQVSSGLSGTLFNELRSKRSLAYTVFGRNESDGQAGLFYGYLAGEAAKEEQAKKGLVEELRRMAKDAVTDENLARAKSSLSGSTRINLQTNTGRQFTYGQDVLLGRGLDYTKRFLEESQKLTTDEVRKAAEKYFSNDNYVMAVVKGKG
jgi:zinc protease